MDRLKNKFQEYTSAYITSDDALQEKLRDIRINTYIIMDDNIYFRLFGKIERQKYRNAHSYCYNSLQQLSVYQWSLLFFEENAKKISIQNGYLSRAMNKPNKMLRFLLNLTIAIFLFKNIRFPKKSQYVNIANN